MANVILLGSQSYYLGIPAQIWRDAIGERVSPKARGLNLQAFDVGREVVEETVEDADCVGPNGYPRVSAMRSTRIRIIRVQFVYRFLAQWP